MMCFHDENVEATFEIVYLFLVVVQAKLNYIIEFTITGSYEVKKNGDHSRS